MSKNRSFQLISEELLAQYQQVYSDDMLNSALEQLEDAELSTRDFNFYIAVAAVYSGKLEGEAIELDSYVKHKRFNIALNPDYIRRTDDLYAAYHFAANTPPQQSSISHIHSLLAKAFVPNQQLGQHRTEEMLVTAANGETNYVAACGSEVDAEMQKLYADLETLLKTELTTTELFFFASMIHLVFVKIHPWQDGNGRTARLLEKWFLSQKIGNKAWFIQSEKYYYTNYLTYADSLKQLGLTYQQLEYSNALPFLFLLPRSLPIAT